MIRDSKRSRSGARASLLRGLLPIEARQVPAEILAGTTLAALAIPEVMGYTKIAGTPVITGLYTILLPMALFAVFGASRHLVVGADSATAAILAAGLAGIASVGSEEYVALAAVLALMAAAFLALARVVRLGFMADFLSRTVLIGFLTGVGIQVALGQVGSMLGSQGSGHGGWGSAWGDLRRLEQVDQVALATAGAVLVVVVGLRTISRRIPGALIAVVGAIAVSGVFDLGGQLHLLGPVPGGLPRLGLPRLDWTPELFGRLLPTAFAMFVVILAQSAATSRAYAARYGERFRANTDLVGLALANIGAGLSGSFVVNGSPTKTQMVDGAGGRTQLAMLVAAFVVLLVLLFLTDALAYLPEPALAAVVFLIGLDLVDLRGMQGVFRRRRSEFWVALITALMVVVVGVELGILLAIVLSLVDHTRHGYRPKNAVLVRTATGAWRPQPVESGAQAAPGLLVYRFTHSMYYANAQQLSDEARRLVDAARPPLRWFCIDAAAVDDVDYTAAETLGAVFRMLNEQGIRPVVAQVLDDLPAESRSGLRQMLGEDAIYASLDQVMEDYRHRVVAMDGRSSPHE